MNESDKEATTLKDRIRMVEDVAEILKDVGIFEAASILEAAAGVLSPSGRDKVEVVFKDRFQAR